MVAVQPTRGLDVGAIETVHKLLLEQRAAGMAVLLISEDLDEVLMLADRVAVIYEGHISESIAVEEAEIAELGLMMTGAALEAQHSRTHPPMTRTGDTTTALAPLRPPRGTAPGDPARPWRADHGRCGRGGPAHLGRAHLAHRR